MKIRSDAAARAQTPSLTRRQTFDARQRLLDGETATAVAARLGISETSLYRMFKRYNIATPKALNPHLASEHIRAGQAAARARGVTFHRPYALTREEAIDAHRRLTKGESVRALARAFGVRPMTLHAALRRHNLEPPSRKLTQEEITDAVRSLVDGERLVTVALGFGIWPLTLLNILRRHGFKPPPASRQRAN
jgi:DNA invertase Pin-like site-specific DNA recombinase